MPQATPPALRDIGVLRLGYASAVAVRVLLGYRALAAGKDGFSESVYDARLSRHHARSARRIYHSVLRLQGLMIKIGQTLGSRPDLLPLEYIQVLARLQDRVPPRPFRRMRPHIEKQLSVPLEQAFFLTSTRAPSPPPRLPRSVRPASTMDAKSPSRSSIPTSSVLSRQASGY